MEKGYYAIIPATVRYDTELKPNEKLLYGEITALCNQQGFCWARNGYFADLYGVHKNTIGTWINHLKELGYIHTNMVYKEDTKSIEKRCISIVDLSTKSLIPYQQKDCEGINEMIDTPINEIIEDNNTSINNTINTTLNKENTKESDEIIFDEKEAFEIFYQTYPIHKSKKVAERSFAKAIKTIGKFDEIMKALEEQKEYYKKMKSSNKFVPEFAMPSTWLNQERWNDELEENENGEDELTLTKMAGVETY